MVMPIHFSCGPQSPLSTTRFGADRARLQNPPEPVEDTVEVGPAAKALTKEEIAQLLQSQQAGAPQAMDAQAFMAMKQAEITKRTEQFKKDGADPALAERWQELQYQLLEAQLNGQGLQMAMAEQQNHFNKLKVGLVGAGALLSFAHPMLGAAAFAWPVLSLVKDTLSKLANATSS